MNNFEPLDNIKATPYRFISNETYVEGDYVDYFYAPRPIIKTDYSDNIMVTYNGFCNLPILAYKAYKDVFGEDAVRLWWVICEFSKLQSINDLENGTILTMPSKTTIKMIIR